MGNYIHYPKDREKYPTKEADPNNFYSDEEVEQLVANLEEVEFSQEDWLKLYNCVDCGLCPTEEKRILLKKAFLEQGFTYEGLEEMRQCFEKYRTPYPTNRMRIRPPEGIPEHSDTLFFMGCLSTIRIPRYTDHALAYLLDRGIDFTILDEEICCGWPWYVSGSMGEYEQCKKENLEIFQNYKKIICLCPACYYLFENEYNAELEKKLDVNYIADLLKPATEKKSGNVGVQHLCQLINRGREGVEEFIDNILRKSGYNVVDVPHWCCGGGIGYMHRTDVIDAIATKRMKDFDREDLDFATTYCVSCWWILRRFAKQCHIHPQAKDIFELLL